MKTLQSAGNSEPAVPLEEMEGNALAGHVLSLMSTHLKSHVIAPFQNEESTLNYVRQLLDFWSHDVTPKLPSVKAPVLLISAEYDQIASPSGSSEATESFPNARHVQVAGGTHYCLYDRPEWMANLVKVFFRESEESSPNDENRQGVGRARTAQEVEE
jgi:pimeloyl-ACP methyl ester carboxylesterase